MGDICKLQMEHDFVLYVFYQILLNNFVFTHAFETKDLTSLEELGNICKSNHPTSNYATYFKACN